MATLLVPDALWDLIEPLLPVRSPRRSGGRPRVPDRACLTGILFVLRSGIPWQMLPQELGCGSGMTCWRRLRDWQEEGLWALMHFALLNWLARYGMIDWSRAIKDSCSVRAVCGGRRPVRILPTAPPNATAPDRCRAWCGASEAAAECDGHVGRALRWPRRGHRACSPAGTAAGRVGL